MSGYNKCIHSRQTMCPWPARIRSLRCWRQRTNTGNRTVSRPLRLCVDRNDAGLCDSTLYQHHGAAPAAGHANLPDCTAPLTKTDTLRPSGWLFRVFGIAPASQPSDAVTPTKSANAMGSGRPASAQEWANGAPTAGGFAWPWPTLQQVTAALAAILAQIAALADDLSAYLLKSGGTMTGFLALYADPTAAAHAATKRYVDAAISAISEPDVSGFVHKSGDTMTGPLLTARDPQSGPEVANKEYVDNNRTQVPLFPNIGSLYIYAATTIYVPPGYVPPGAPANSTWTVIGDTGIVGIQSQNAGSEGYVASVWATGYAHLLQRTE